MEQLKLTKTNLPLLIATIFCIEVLIYFWAVWTSTLDRSNFFSIEPDFIFDKAARNSGRVSAALLLTTLLMVGYYGLKEVYSDVKKLDTFRILITLFTFNHLIHFVFLFLRFKGHAATLDISENMLGFITFICIIIVPFILWTNKNLNMLLYVAIVLYLYNTSYFINKTFWSKVKPEDPAYHNQFGIIAITAACLFILYSVYKDSVQNAQTK